MKNNAVLFIDTLNVKMSDFQVKAPSSIYVKKKSLVIKVSILFLSFLDFLILLFTSSTFKRKKTKIYFTHSSFIKQEGKKNVDVFYKDLLEKTDAIFISYDKYNYLNKVSSLKVYNLGVLVRILDYFNIVKSESRLKNFTRWKFVLEPITKKLKNNPVFIPVYSNDTGFGLIFNKYRANFKLIEVQHGSVINYPPYSFISKMPLVDVFHYRDERSKVFLLENLFLLHTPKMIIIKKNDIELLPATSNLEILYVSSYEYNGFHPVFENYIRLQPSNCHVTVRLHPRQKQIESTFVNKLTENNISFTIDNSNYWYDAVRKNTVVISPFSSVIEEAVSIGVKTLIIDSLGEKRFAYLIDGVNCIFTQDITNQINLR